MLNLLKKVYLHVFKENMEIITSKYYTTTFTFLSNGINIFSSKPREANMNIKSTVKAHLKKKCAENV